MPFFTATAQLKSRRAADVLVLPFWQTSKGAKAAVALDSLPSLTSVLDTGDFTGEEKSFLLCYVKSALEPRIYLLGLGKAEDADAHIIKTGYGEAVRLCRKKGWKKVALVMPAWSELRKITPSGCVRAAANGALLVNYSYEEFHSQKKEGELVTSIQLIGVAPKLLEEAEEEQAIMEGVYLARDLINGSAHTITPSYLAEVAKKIAKGSSAAKVEVFDRKKIEQEKMGLLAAVAKGAAEEPRFIILRYKGQPKSKDHTVLVGKGITYDTGGLNLKPTGSMETMKSDMSGAAAVLGTLSVAISLKLPFNITAVIPSTENAIGSKSYKPGDVYTAYEGSTVEIANTDAEGRLVLADAIAYTIKHLSPTRIIDLATLTGACVIALGGQMAALYCNQEKLANKLLASSERTEELLWRMPLFAPYKELIKSKIADIANSGGRPAGSITAALFLEHFVTKNIAWAHLDIAGVAFQEKENGIIPKHGVGFGVRLLIDFLKSLNS